ncbi:MAG: hypothetical protein LBU74_01215 [Methanobacteriaceae archaeon]|jgi:hypothetical protein|nr:hypothetical protein [Candidatus Methanorudis spinitermitis]
MNKSNIKLILIILVIFVGITLFIDSHETSETGSQSIGYVVKDTYSHYPNPNGKIAIVSGMHPREKLSSQVLPIVIKIYSVLNNVEIVNYQVIVLDNPDDFYIGRSNGEKLVHDYVVKDIDKSNFDLVIIAHDHEKGYGEGFYIATPSMDSKSVILATKVMKDLDNFNYYKRNVSKIPESSSIRTVDNPIVATGTPLFVYEIPEWLGFFEVFIESYSFIDASFKST